MRIERQVEVAVPSRELPCGARQSVGALNSLSGAVHRTEKSQRCIGGGREHAGQALPAHKGSSRKGRTKQSGNTQIQLDFRLCIAGYRGDFIFWF